MENKDAELKPCPFCGNKEIKVAPLLWGEVAAVCELCDLYLFDSVEESNLKEKWNRRVHTKYQVDGEELTPQELLERYIAYRKQLGYWRESEQGFPGK